MVQAKATVLVVDRKESLVMELRDNSKTTFIEAIGLSTYSNSKAGVSSYVAIFENLWRQTELYTQLKEANERLKVHDKMQKEFINIAAHELRTPVQPILSLTEIIRRKENDSQQKQLLDIIVRNAQKLKRLTEDVLDVTRIESNSLQLKKEEFDLNDLLIHVVQDYKNQISANNNNMEIRLVCERKEVEQTTKGTVVQADKYRINQVVSNLVNNAIKITREGGTIAIKIKTDNNSDGKIIIVSVKDTGTGIDPEIMPRLFSKFATKSDSGTGIGLGLYISKSIVEAHGGEMWAEKNNDGKGATFSFSLPSVSNVDNIRITH
jgi:signal transduction histidine kinase